MQDGFASERSIRAALADRAYAADQVRICDPDLRGFECLAASRNGLFAVGPHGAKRIAFGFFFGVRQRGNALFLFESCGVPSARSDKGRIVRLRLDAGVIADAAVIAKGLDSQCHQLAVIDSCICLVDTANQAIRRFTLDGAPVDVRHPFADASAPYHHVNSIALVRGQVAILLHNGTSEPRRPSELAWLDADWRPVRRQRLAGYCCHDILEDAQGVLWHCGSMSGTLLRSAGPPVQVSDRMTRGLAMGRRGLIVGTSLFGVRAVRADLPGSVIFLDSNLRKMDEIELPAAPTDLIAL
ncbi:hypothetical protein [Sphingomonas sp. MS122]|uniref:hypothetical protein n=1 Tax=Sphingomonas sp. MS122 TaxID=3412683 RepID=UPI003C304018